MRVPKIETHGRQILGVESLHHQHYGPALLIIKPRRQRSEEILDHALSYRVALDGEGRVRVIDDNAVAAFPGDGTPDGGRHHAPTVSIAILRLLVLVLHETYPIPTQTAVPRRQEQLPSIKGELDRQPLTVTDEHPAAFGRLQPLPYRPHHRHEQRFHVPRRDVDDELLEVADGNRFEVLTDQINVPIREKRRRRLQEGPRLLHEATERPPGPAFQLFRLERRHVPSVTGRHRGPPPRSGQQASAPRRHAPRGVPVGGSAPPPRPRR